MWLCEESVRILQLEFGESLEEDDEGVICTDTSDGESDLEDESQVEEQGNGGYIGVELGPAPLVPSANLQLNLVPGPSAVSILGSEGSSSNPLSPTERSLSISRLSSSSSSSSEFPPCLDEYTTYHQPQHAVSPPLPTEGNCAAKQSPTPQGRLVAYSYPLLIIITMIAFGPQLVGDSSA